MNLLIHLCCAPCGNAPIAKLQNDNHNISALWYNPNIHPFTEYRSRKQSVIDFTKEKNIPLFMEDDYGLRSFTQAVIGDLSARCPHCYRIRLEKTAQIAKENWFDGFTASLLISPYQNHELLRKIGEELGETYDIPFYYEDFRPLFREGQSYARENEFYMQKYCGCIFSEEDRYTKKKSKAKK